MAPAERASGRTGITIAAIEVVVTAIGIGLKDAPPPGEMPVRVSHLPIAREVEQRGRRRTAREGPVVADIGPEPRGLRAAPGQERHRGVVAVQPLGGQDMGPDQRMNRLQRNGAGADLVSQGGQADLDTFLGVALDLPVQRLMLAELLEQDHRQQVGPSPATGRGMERRWRLADLLACPAGELLADRLDHLPLPGNDLQRLGDILAHLHDAIRATAGTGRGRRNHHALARQIGDRRLAGIGDRPLGKPGHAVCIIAVHRLDFGAQDATAERLALGDRIDDRRASSLSAASARASEAASAARNLVISEAASDMAETYHAGIGKPIRIRLEKPIYPAFAGRCVQRGLRQSIPSKR